MFPRIFARLCFHIPKKLCIICQRHHSQRSFQNNDTICSACIENCTLDPTGKITIEVVHRYRRRRRRSIAKAELPCNDATGPAPTILGRNVYYEMETSPICHRKRRGVRDLSPIQEERRDEEERLPTMNFESNPKPRY